MNNNYFCVPLNPTEQDKECYRNNDTNLGEVEIAFPDGKIIDNQDHKVILTFSRDAMLGLGSALIRCALSSNQQDICWEFENATRKMAIERQGIYLHPNSCKLIINRSELGKLQDLLK